MTTKTKILALVGGLSLTLTAFVSGCGDTSGNPDGPMIKRDMTATPDMTVIDTGDMAKGMTPDMDCYSNPMTHYEIINACTTAMKLLKPNVTPTLPDGGMLPKIP